MANFRFADNPGHSRVRAPPGASNEIPPPDASGSRQIRTGVRVQDRRSSPIEAESYEKEGSISKGNWPMSKAKYAERRQTKGKE
jgi:hypothetical protein